MILWGRYYMLLSSFYGWGNGGSKRLRYLSIGNWWAGIWSQVDRFQSLCLWPGTMLPPRWLQVLCGKPAVERNCHLLTSLLLPGPWELIVGIDSIILHEIPVWFRIQTKPRCFPFDTKYFCTYKPPPAPKKVLCFQGIPGTGSIYESKEIGNSWMKILFMGFLND